MIELNIFNYLMIQFAVEEDFIAPFLNTKIIRKDNKILDGLSLFVYTTISVHVNLFNILPYLT